MRHPHGLRAAAGAGGGIVLPEIGTFMEGGYFAGAISHTADENPTHLLIVSPRSAAVGPDYGTGAYPWNTNVGTNAPNRSYSTFDGFADTVAVAATDFSFAAARYARGRTTNGYSDWYLPSRFEWDIMYYNLKPTNDINRTNYGANPYSVPRRDSNNTESIPGQTNVDIFKSGGSQALVRGPNSDSGYWLSEGYPNLSSAYVGYVWGAFTAGGVTTKSINRQWPNILPIRKVAL